MRRPSIESLTRAVSNPPPFVDLCVREGLVALELADPIPSPPTQAYFLFCMNVPAEASQRPNHSTDSAFSEKIQRQKK